MVQFGSDAGPLIDTGCVITSEYVLLAVAPVTSLIVTVTFDVPAAVGVPAITPVAGSSKSPAGSPVADHVYGGVPPPLGVNVKLYGRFFSLAGKPAVALLGAGLLVSVDASVDTAPVLSEPVIRVSK